MSDGGVADGCLAQWRGVHSVAFETVFQAMVSVLKRSAKENGRSRGAHSSGDGCTVRGRHGGGEGDDREVADELRVSCMAVALELGGWDQPSLRPRAINTSACERMETRSHEYFGGRCEPARGTHGHSRVKGANMRADDCAESPGDFLNRALVDSP